MGDLISLEAERNVRRKVAQMLKDCPPEKPKRYLIVRLGTDGKRYLEPRRDNLTEDGALVMAYCLRGCLAERPNPHTRDYQVFSYLPGERGKLIEEERIVE